MREFIDDAANKVNELKVDLCRKCECFWSDDFQGEVEYGCSLRRDADKGCGLAFLPKPVQKLSLRNQERAEERIARKEHCKDCEEKKGCKRDVYECMS